jgi:sporulation protein YlmC with PRC-barrel domain
MDTEQLPQEITTLVGREVYSNSGVFVGEVEDIRLNLDKQSVTGLALHQLNAELFDAETQAARGVILPYRWVQAVGDVIIVNEIIERVHQPEETTEDEEVPA